MNLTRCKGQYTQNLLTLQLSLMIHERINKQ